MKKLKIILILFLLAPSIVLATDFDITAENVILYNLNDDTILYEQNSTEKTSIASLTKMMTALVAIETIPDLDATVVISEEDFVGTNGYSKAGFSVGDEVTYLDLLYGIILPSGAEAVNATVNNTLGYDAFVSAMNTLAEEIGSKNTSFSNPIGKDDEDNYSTASDVALLLKYALENPTFKEIFTTKEYTTTNNVILESTLDRYKDFLEVDQITGAKSGFTLGAGMCLASIATLNEVDYLLVVIKSTTTQNYSAVLDTITIYDYYSTNYSYQNILSTSDIITTIPIKWSQDKEYTITGPENIDMFLENGTSDNLEIKYDGVSEIKKGTKKGTELGTITVLNDDEVLYTSSVTLNEDITYYHPLLWLIIALVILLLITRLFRRKKRRRVRCK